MYLVGFKEFDKFLTNKSVSKEFITSESTPFILEFKRDGVMLAKVEMSNIDEYKFLQKYPNSYNPKTSKNKYWIRGQEWECINDCQIQKLAI